MNTDSVLTFVFASVAFTLSSKLTTSLKEAMLMSRKSGIEVGLGDGLRVDPENIEDILGKADGVDSVADGVETISELRRLLIPIQ